MNYLRRTWAEINLNNLGYNYRQVRKLLKPQCKMMAVVKADAYGHGDGYVARELQSLGADWFAVSNINEAYSLRKYGIERPILILGATPIEKAEALAENKITQALYSSDYAQALSEQATAKKLTIDCHILVDTGMSRLGFFAQKGHGADAAAEIVKAVGLMGLSCTGIFTHFSSADDFSAESIAYTEEQYAVFKQVLSLLEAKGVTFPIKHCCNSAATIAYNQWQMDMIRPGVILYGMPPSEQMKGRIDLKPVMSLYSTVAMSKTVGAGVAIGYDRRYITKKPTQQIATIEVGYDDGYRRNFTNRGRVLINGQFAPVTGSVCMDQIMVDCSSSGDVKEQNLVTMVGSEGTNQITLDDYAKINGTINYEESCLIGLRVPRVFVRDGKEEGVMDYVLASLP